MKRAVAVKIERDEQQRHHEQYLKPSHCAVRPVSGSERLEQASAQFSKSLSAPRDGRM
jgi:hypothetical protein